MSGDDYSMIAGSDLFDSAWYQKRYPDVQQSGLSPVEHYLRFGAVMGRDPSPNFRAARYCEQHPDVARSKANPLLHYLKSRTKKQRNTPKAEAAGPPERIDIVVPVYNALTDVKRCVESVLSRTDFYDIKLVIVDDASGEETATWLQNISVSDKRITLITNSVNLGYTKSVNRGMKQTDAPFVVVLNSDTIVTRHWLTAMRRCFGLDQRLGIVGPLSNAASWQSIPDLLDETGHFSTNPLDRELTPEDIATLVSKTSKKLFPRVPFINGFCFMIRREVIETIGYMDEETFPVGYGEENDYCIRASEAGYALAVADDAYVYHAKSRSFGNDRRNRLSNEGSRALKLKHGAEALDIRVDTIKTCKELILVRSHVKQVFDQWQKYKTELDITEKRILFVLPVKGGGGGVHSVVQEVSEMRRFGVDAKVGVRSADIAAYSGHYAREISSVRDVFFGIDIKDTELARQFDIVVATIYFSIFRVEAICRHNERILPCYYVQDYEPMFFEPGSQKWTEARRSYGLINNVVLFAKTDWLRRQVMAEHGVVVHKVQPSIDHGIYAPARRERSSTLRISAMIRPQTPRRGAARTMRLLSALSRKFGEHVQIDIFGCASDVPAFGDLEQDFPFVNHGTLPRLDVASVLRSSDIFVDLSDYQAFGRTALEAMACGCAAVVPAMGGADEYALNGVNALVVNTQDEQENFVQVSTIIENVPLLRQIQRAGLETAAKYSIRSAAISEMKLFATQLALHMASLGRAS